MPDGSPALDELVRENLEAGLRLATRLTGSVIEAEDVVQEALVRVVQSYDQLRHPGAFRTWFFRIILNLVRDRFRSRRYDTTDLTVELSIAGPEDPLKAVELSELEELVRKYIAELPSRQREAMILRVLEGLSLEETANIMGTSATNVRVLVFEARRRLAERLRPYLRPENE